MAKEHSTAFRTSQECSGSLGTFWLRIKQKSSLSYLDLEERLNLPFSDKESWE